MLLFNHKRITNSEIKLRNKIISVIFFLLLGFSIPATFASAAYENSFVTVQGSKLMVSNKEYYVRGVNYFGGRYIPTFVKDGNGYESVNQYQIFHNFSAADIENEFKFLKTELNINTIRLLTPSKTEWEPFVTYHNWNPWYLSDGSISPVYRDRIQTILSIAKKYGIRIQLALAWYVPTELGTTAGPGSSTETFYYNYLNSLVPSLRNDPALLSYEISNETLIQSDPNSPNLNFWQIPSSTRYEQRVLSFTRRMITRIRSLDSNHLIASGEVVMPSGSPWWPTPELTNLPDIDNLNGGQAYSLASLVDYLAPHLYISQNDTTTADQVAANIRANTSKPVVFGESGYMDTNPCISVQSQITSAQSTAIQRLTSAARDRGLNGVMVWDPYPQVSLGQYSAVPMPAGQGYSGECPYAEVVGPPARKLRGIFPVNYKLFSYDTLAPLPAAGVFKQSASDKSLNDSGLVSFSAPSQITAGQQFTVNVSVRNTGTKTWTNSEYQIIDRGYALSPSQVNFGNLGSILPVSKVEPGEVVSFGIVATAPQAPGTYPVALQMIQSGVEFFGDVPSQQAQVVTVSNPPPPTPPVIIPPALPPAAPNPAPPSSSPISPTLYPSGTIFKYEGNPTVYIKEGTIARPITDWTVYLNQVPQTRSIVTIPSSVTFPQGPVLGLRSGTLIKSSDNPTVYLIVNGKKQAFSSAQEFYNHNYNFSNVYTINDPTLVNSIETTTEPFVRPFGTLFKYANSPAVYFLNAQRQKRGYTTLATFNIWNATLKDVITIPDTEIYPDGPVATLPNGIVVRGSSSIIYYVYDGVLRPFNDLTLFTAMGFKMTDVKTFSDADLNLHPYGNPM